MIKGLAQRMGFIKDSARRVSFYYIATGLVYRTARLPFCLEGKWKLHQTLTQDGRLPRVDVHVHLAVDPVQDSKDPDAARRFYSVISGTLQPFGHIGQAIAQCELDEIERLMEAKTPVERSAEELADKVAAKEVVTIPGDTARMLRHALLNQAFENVPEVLGAAAKGGRPEDPEFNRPALVVALVADFSQTPILRDGGSTGARVASTTRAVLSGYVGEIAAPERWYGRLPPGVRCVGWTPSHNDAGVSALETALEEHRWLTRVSGGAVVAFAGYDPRTPAALERLKQWVLTRESPGKGMVGIKCYSRCGWTAESNWMLYGRNDGDALDRSVLALAHWAEKQGVPVTNHHTPGGWPAAGQLVPPKGARGLFTQPDVPPITGQPGSTRWLAGMVAAETAAQCAYVQCTASPSLWKPILKRHPNLRLNLAHAGTAAAGLCRYSDLTRQLEHALKAGSAPSAEVDYLIQWPPAAGQKWFASLFPLAAAKRLQELVACIPNILPAPGLHMPKPEELPGRMFAAVPFVSVARPPGAQGWHEAQRFWISSGPWPNSRTLSADLADVLCTPEWKSWIGAFAQSLGPDWLTQCLDLAAEYPNVYTDLSYFSVEGSTLKDVLQHLFREAFRDGLPGSTLGRKLMFGTDWFVTETERVSAWQFWQAIREAFDETVKVSDEQREQCWEDLTCHNALRFLNLGPRFGQWEEFLAANHGREGDFAVGPQAWWHAVKRWYERGAGASTSGAVGR